MTIADQTATRLMLLDGHSLVHRAFHALPPLTTSHGELINAVFGFSSMLLKAIDTIRPTHVIMTLDRSAPTFRHQAYAEYKATRPRTPQELVSQFKRVREVSAALNIPIYEMDGFEADDLLGTLSEQAEQQGVSTVIVTGDLDALQLVSGGVNVLTPRQGIAETVLYDAAAVRERYGLEPKQLPDWKALVGDTSDNIPGVPGIGAKTASKLIGTYESLGRLYEHLDDIPAKTRTSLEENRDQVFASRHLAQIVRDVPISLSMDDSAYKDVDRSQLLTLFRELEFRTLIERVQYMLPRESTVGGGSVQQLSMFSEPADRSMEVIASTNVRVGATATDLTTPINSLDRSAGDTVTTVVQDEGEFEEMLSDLRSKGTFALDTETTGTDALRARLVGLSFSTQPRRAWYVPVGHAEGKQLSLSRVLAQLRPLLEDSGVPKIGHNLKYERAILSRYDIALGSLRFDTMIAAYLVKTSSRGLSLSALALDRLGIEMTPIESLIGKGKGQTTMDLVGIESVAAYAGADADITLRLRDTLLPELASLELEALFHDVEMPLVHVLADMEQHGVALDTRVLATMSREMMEIIGRLEGRIYEIAGRPFNISSTQQLGQLLFGELGLPSGRRTKTGYSTDVEVLERLRGRHEIVDLVLEYRQLIKLKNTYVDALPSLINPDDAKVHTDFNQTVAATGRLSSSNPNLQNIPIRGELGRRIRRAFVPSKTDNVLLAADYSQIELRILAAMSHDPRLLDAFRSGEDIHAVTASGVFGVALEDVSTDQRRIAKIVNFGIIYGIGEQRLAHETGISREEAAEFIANYNRTYAGVKTFMDTMRRSAALYGYVSTLLNRRRYIPEIHSTNPGIRTAAERAAINMPIQGTAADIIKVAMIRIHRSLAESYPGASMVLQVHDELVFDVPAAQLDDVAVLVRDLMENAMELEVPLEVELKSGPNWYEMDPIERVN